MKTSSHVQLQSKGRLNTNSQFHTERSRLNFTKGTSSTPSLRKGFQNQNSHRTFLMMKDLMQKNNASLAPIPYDPFRSKSKANLVGPYNNSIATSKGIYAGNTNGDGKLTMDLKTMSMFKKSGTEQAPYVLEWDKNTPMIRT